MVNFKKLADRAKKAREVVEQQGGTDALKAKADRIREAARTDGSVADKAKAAAAVAREKPNPAAPAPDEDAAGPIGGGAAPPPPAAETKGPVKPANPELAGDPLADEAAGASSQSTGSGGSDGADEDTSGAASAKQHIEGSAAAKAREVDFEPATDPPPPTASNYEPLTAPGRSASTADPRAGSTGSATER